MPQNGRNILLLALMLLLACASIVSRAHAEEVTSTGIAPYDPGREAVAREKALHDARRNAVEATSGGIIDASTTVRNNMLVSDNILSRAAGYVSEYTVLSERKSNGLYEVTIRANVLVDSMRDDANTIRRLVALQQTPHVIIKIASETPAENRTQARRAASLLADKLKKSGLTVVDKPLTGTELELNLALEQASTPATVLGVQMMVNEISLVTDIVRPSDGRTLASSTETVKVNGLNKLQALEKGTKECVQKTWKRLARALSRSWEEEMESARTLYVTVLGLDSKANAETLAGAFRSSVPNVETAALQSMQEGEARFTLRYKGQPRFFTDEISMRYFRNRYGEFAVTSVRDNVITLTRQ
ncbi:flagellar assembly protein T N-terminal domain-containing protein [Desulfovibrio mangrovi]|uniref:flagellar assembly protein T N-terminal domain-containing protein n=1 Tax=Desulfovibrio mangrovi TaxID=2976983 RepID=UPI0022454AF6|nr:flagellar assembly protein T N-terminal domain-containing protein [Desulfovibrio mangrovi]UZP67001.1 flagellar assembly protein T N-terminal domain-containing protein [Desulfovibrio mangrovi]